MSVLPHFTQDILPSQPRPAPPRHDTSSSHRPDAHQQTQAHRPDTRPLITHELLPSLCSRGLMGNLLKVLACTELEHGPIVFLDFERETIRCFFFFQFIFQLPLFSALPMLCFHPHSISLSYPLCHLYIFIYPSLPSALLLLLIWAPGTGIWLRSKGTYSQTSHLGRCRQLRNVMATFFQNHRILL